MIVPRTPTLIGAGQVTYRKGAAPGPCAMMVEAAQRAVADAGLAAQTLARIDTLGVVGFTIDSTPARFPRLDNPPAALAQALDAAPRVAVYTHMGGNTPQALINWAAQRIADGETELALLVGAEFLGTLVQRLKAGADVAEFQGGPEGEPERWGDPRPGTTPQESAHGLDPPANVYPIFENAFRARLKRDLDAHRQTLGRLFAPFSKVAAANPHAWFPIERTPQEIIEETPDNRMVGYPYTKYLNAIIQVDQAAGVVMASAAMADALGVAHDKRVYLHGCAEAHEPWFVLQRRDYHSAPAIGACAAQALDMAGRSIDGIDAFDIYSCFPVAVEIACAELGLDLDDPRGLTLTGGLPYFGGPGNNYAMHGVAEAMARARAKPGSFAMVTANGWYLTKHAIGIYSAEPTRGPWRRPDPKAPQRLVDALACPDIIDEPNGPARIEAYTVVHGREGPERGIVIGRDGEGRRFVANTPRDAAVLMDLQSKEGVGRSGRAASEPGGKKNVFTPD